jgi:hypothetical protein
MTQVHEAPPTSSPPPGPEPRRTLYEVLQVSPRAEEGVLRAAYRALARELHPDLNPTPLAADQMRELNAAYDVLNDPRQRTLYDLHLNQTREADFVGDFVAQGIRRRTSCWRCQTALAGAYARYCSECHWITCHACRACGCEHPGWQERRRTRAGRWRLLAVAGWVSAVLLALGWLGSLTLTVSSVHF